MGITFTTGDVPPSTDTELPPSTDPVCETCGTGLYYGGRGRKPRFCDEHKPTATRSATPRRSARDVEAAMAALDSAHTSLSFVLMLVAGDAAVAWEQSRPALDERNRRILDMDPALAKRLANMAAKGGAPALVLSHLIAIAPAAGMTFAKVKAARDARPKPEPETPIYDNPQGYEQPVDNGVYIDPVDAAFQR